MIDDQINDVRIDVRLATPYQVPSEEQVLAVDREGGLEHELQEAHDWLLALDELRRLREDLQRCVERGEPVLWRVYGEKACDEFLASSAQEAARKYVEKYEPDVDGETVQCRPVHLPDRAWEEVAVCPGKKEETPNSR